MLNGGNIMKLFFWIEKKKKKAAQQFLLSKISKLSKFHNDGIKFRISVLSNSLFF